MRTFQSDSAHAQDSRLHLVEWIGSGAPVGEEQAEANSLEDSADNTNGNEVKRSLLADDLCNQLRWMSVKFRDSREITYTWASGCEED